jgi:3-phosphoshikimate 1-carboxyvinyltransferase
LTNKAIWFPHGLSGQVALPASKSESNRLLILKKLFPALQISGLSTADDTRILQNVLQSSSTEHDLGHAGTAMRFATAYFSGHPGNVVLRGSDRMHNRPIAPLVQALRDLGADIEYLRQPGFPPLGIRGKVLSGGVVTVDASVSSQFVSALMLVGSTMKNGLLIHLSGEVVSGAYSQLTADIIRRAGGEVVFSDRQINISYLNTPTKEPLHVHADWSAAVFAYAWLAVCGRGRLGLINLQKNSRQPDARVVGVFEKLGIVSTWERDILWIEKQKAPVSKLDIDCQDSPDMAQALIVAMAALGISGTISGLKTLRLKETDRIEALRNELQVFGLSLQISDDEIVLSGIKLRPPSRPIQTYDDHRMAMAFSALGGLFPIEIENYEVVSKSFPEFWSALNHVIVRQ